jgi:hypothetical protein
VKMWFLCYFYHRLLDYRRPEVAALAKLFGGDAELQWKLPLNHHEDSPFHFIWLPSEEIASKIANRSKQLNSSICVFTCIRLSLNCLLKMLNASRISHFLVASKYCTQKRFKYCITLLAFRVKRTRALNNS